MADRPPRPAIDVTPYDDSSWEVYLDTQTDLNLSVKVGYDSEGRPYIVADPDSDHEYFDQGKSHYGHWTARVPPEERETD